MKKVKPSFLPNTAISNPWIVFDYEIQMFFETRKAIDWVNLKLKTDASAITPIMKNAVVESLVFHTRQVIDILISKVKSDDDISLMILLPAWCETLKAKQLIAELTNAYGSANDIGSPRWTFNKMLAHPTRFRSDSFDYGSAMNKVEGPIDTLLRELLKDTNRPILKHYLN